MPWMIFYQQGAVIDKRLSLRDLRPAQWDTAIGAILTQLVMIAVLVATAAAAHGVHHSLNTVGQLAGALSVALGSTSARLLLTLGLTGAALLASVVVSLAAAWAVAEVAGSSRSLDDRPRKAPLFYALYAAMIGIGATLVLSAHSLVAARHPRRDPQRAPAPARAGLPRPARVPRPAQGARAGPDTPVTRSASQRRA